MIRRRLRLLGHLGWLRQKKGIGLQMVSKLIAKLSHQGREYLGLEVRETNLVAQRFFHSCGFKGITTLPDYYHQNANAVFMRFDFEDLEFLKK